MNDQPKVWCPVCLTFHEHVTDAQLEQLRAERAEIRADFERVRKTLNEQCGALKADNADYSEVHDNLAALYNAQAAELSEARAQLKAAQEQRDAWQSMADDLFREFFESATDAELDEMDRSRQSP